MTAAKHTPGPWRYAAEANDGRGRGYIRTEFGRDTGGSGIAVARLVARAEFGPAQYDANAQLIAAAPDMLAEIEATADELDNEQGCYCDEPPPGESGVVECAPCRDRRIAKRLRSLAAKAGAL